MRWIKALLFLGLVLPAFAQFGSNARKIMGTPLCNPLAPADGQALVWNATSGCWAPAGTTAGAVAWGSITGTLSSQSDLNTALGLKAPLVSPTFVTPALGTPSAAVLTNATGLPNTGLLNSSVTIAGHSVALGGTQALACSDLTGVAASCSTDTTNGTNISSGTVAAARLGLMTGDSGSGGAKGAVPAPATGDAAALKFLKADGTWAVPSGSSGYSTIDSGGSAVTQRGTVNFISAGATTVTCVDNSGSTRTDCTFSSTGGGTNNPGGSSGDIQTNNGAGAFGAAHMNDNATSITITEPVAVKGTAIGEFMSASTVNTSPRGITSGQFSTDTASSRFNGYKARGTQASPTTVVTADFLTRWSGWGYDSANYIESASIVMGAQGTIAATRVPSFIGFSTGTDAAPTVLTEAMRIDAAQHVCVGVTSCSSMLTVGGAAALGVAGSTVGSLAFLNATSGAVTLSPATGALGSTAITLPAASGTAVVAATSTTATQALFATATAGAPGYRAMATTDLPTVSLRRTCSIDNDTQSATALTAANFSGHCYIPAAATIVEVSVIGGTGVLTGSAANPTVSGTSSVQIGKYSPNGGTTNNALLSGLLATASGKACAMTSTSGTCIDGTTSSGTITVSTTALSAGDMLYPSAASADASQTWYRVSITYTIN